jgi:outer membrane protein assembly factor BamB
MQLAQLIFVGLNGYAVALDRETGDIVWSQNKLEGGYVTLLLDGDQLIVSCNGYMYALDPFSGDILWHNRMKGYGSGCPTSITSVRGTTSTVMMQQAAEIATQASVATTTATFAASS